MQAEIRSLAARLEPLEGGHVDGVTVHVRAQLEACAQGAAGEARGSRRIRRGLLPATAAQWVQQDGRLHTQPFRRFGDTGGTSVLVRVQASGRFESVSCFVLVVFRCVQYPAQRAARGLGATSAPRRRTSRTSSRR